MAVFGAPRPFRDHAERRHPGRDRDRRRVNEKATRRADLRVGVGVNTGSVVAGAIGGGGRLNFSVIGDAVNVAARVEAATRLDRDVLITAATAEELGAGLERRAGATHELKGVGRPVELFALGPREPGQEPPSAELEGESRGLRRSRAASRRGSA